MSKFTPDAGVLHYVSCKPLTRVIGDGLFGGILAEPKVVEQQDRSYQGDIFRCVARDSHAIVSERLTGFMSGSRLTFVITNYEFAPVGPDVAAAVGIANEAAKE